MVSSAAESRCSCPAGLASISRDECSSDVIGASELLTSWLSTRIAFFQVSTSLRASSLVSGFSMNSVCGCVEISK